MCCAIPFALTATPARAQSDVVREYVQAQLEWRQVPGLAFAVVKGGRVVRAEAFGVANRDTGDSTTVNTVFQMGSVGKQFTAAAILLLAEEGRLGLDDSVVRHVRGGPAAWRGITLRHLLTHTSGLGDYDNAIPQLDREYSPPELIALIASQPLAFRPGSGYRYSNSGYALLGFVVEAVSGEHLGDFLSRRVFVPLGMNATGMVGRAPAPIANAAVGSRLADGVLGVAPPVSRSLNSTGDGSLHSTVLDMARWDAALYGDGLLSAASRAAMWTPVRQNDGRVRQYGFGWGIATHRGHRILEHGGAWQGFAAHIARYPDDSTTVVVLTNLTGVGNTAGVIANRIARYYIPALRAGAWPARPAIVLDTATLDGYTGDFQLGTATIRIRRSGTQLVISTTGRGSARMVPRTRTEFSIDADDVRFRFRPRQGRRADLYIVDGRERLAKRLK